jgi:hypothetical protein
VKTLPAAISGNMAICSGHTSVATDPSAPGMSWTSSNTAVATIGASSGVITGISAGTSVITFKATNGCIATRVATVDLSPATAPITGGSGVAVGHTIALADAVPGGIWSSSNPALATVDASGVVTGVAAGAANISYTMTNGVCQIPVVHSIAISSSKEETGVGNAGDKVTNVQLYPNPNMGTFTFDADEDGVCEIYELSGKQVARYLINSGNNLINLPAGMAAGVYMCHFKGNNGGEAMVKFLIQQQ